MNLIESVEVLNDGTKRSSPFSEPVPNESAIGPAVVIAMEDYVVKLLGREFYNLLVEEKDGRISIYNPSDRRGESVVAAFTNAKYEELWRKGGLRDYCGWCVALVYGNGSRVKIKQGGSTKFEGGANEKGADGKDEDRTLQVWESGVETLGNKVKEYLFKNKEETEFALYKTFLESIIDNEDPLFREVGILKTRLPLWN